MNSVESKVRTARFRILLAQFGKSLCLTLFAGLLVATIAIAVPLLYPLDVDRSTWVYAWLGGCVMAAITAAAIHTYLTAPSVESVAAEVDRRFGLRERLSSSITLPNEERDSAFGVALTADAEKRANQLEVADRFSLKPNKLGWLPLAIVPVLAIVMALEPLNQSSASSAKKPDASEVEQVKTVAKQLKKRIQQQRRKAQSEGLKEAEELFDKMEADLNKITKRDSLSKKEAMIALNDLKKQLEDRKQQLGSSQQVQRALSQMKGIESGPGEKIAKSIAKGNFSKAQDMVQQLASKMRSGDMSEKEKQQLEKQIQQMKDALQKAADQHKQKKKELEEKIEQARQQGKSDEADKMQQQLNQMQQQDSQMQKMQQMAQSMGKASDAMKQGNSQQAADALQEMADQLSEMDQEMSELQDLESAMNELSQSKSQMRCQKCGGGGCQQCQGSLGQFGFGDGQNGQGFGMGRGSGAGDRPEQEEDTNTYETQVRGKLDKGKAIIAGFADGPNRKGISREDVQRAVEGAISDEADPTENQTLPRTEREHAQQYFDRLREGT